MAKVRSVRVHQNLYGTQAQKDVGDEYEIPDSLVPALVGAGLVESVVLEESEPEPKAKAKK